MLRRQQGGFALGVVPLAWGVADAPPVICGVVASVNHGPQERFAAGVCAMGVVPLAWGVADALPVLCGVVASVNHNKPLFPVC